MRAVTDDALDEARFPRSNRYNPAWLVENPMGAHPLWLTEWLCERLPLTSGMRVLDLGCGKAKSSVFLAREYGVEVWAIDLWTGATENLQRIEDAGLVGRVHPIHADARQLPFAAGFFDAVVCIDSFNYFGTDDLYLNYLASFLRADGMFGFVSAGLVEDFGAAVPDHLQRFWGADAWTIHTAEWWRHHLAKTRLVDVVEAGVVEDGWRLWARWAAATDASAWYREVLRADAGRYLGYVGAVARRVAGASLAPYAWPATLRSEPSRYERHPMLREP